VPEKVAAHYGIPSLNLAREVTERIDAGEFSWEKDFKDLHPSPFGQNLYYQSIRSMLEAAWADHPDADTPTPHNLPEMLDPYSYDAGKIIPPDAAGALQGWKLFANWQPDDSARTRPGYTDVPMLVSEQPGSGFELKFHGRAVGIAVAAGPDAGMIEYQIDQQARRKLDLYTRWSHFLHIPWYYVLASELEEGEHSLRIWISSDKNPSSKGYACRIKHLFVND
jgi:hypothetical protein